MNQYILINSDSRRIPIADRSIDCVVTSPPYFGLRDYGDDRQIGLEETPDEFVASLVGVFREVRRVMKDEAVLWLNLGDSYNAYNGGAGPSSSISRGASTTERPKLASGYGLRFKGLKPKDLIGIPWRVAFALQADGWYLRSDIIWHKPNPMPESVTDRPTKSHEYVFLLSKSERYFYDAEAVREPDSGQDHPRKVLSGQPSLEPSGGLLRVHSGLRTTAGRDGTGRNLRTVWTISNRPYKGAHFATFPPSLAERCIKAGCPVGGIVLDPFNGAGTTGVVALSIDRRYIGAELNRKYIAQSKRRIDRPHAPISREAKAEELPLFG